MIEIYGSNDRLKCQVEAGSSSQQDKALQSDNVLSLSFTHYAFLQLDVNDWCEFAGERYWLQEKYLPKQKNEHEWEYNVKLYGIESLIKRLLVLQNSDGENEAVFTLTAPASEHVRLIVESINSGMGGTTNWKVGDVVATENLTIDYDGTYCDEGLRLVAEAAGTEWWIEGETVNLCRCEQGAELPLRYGESLLSLDRDEADGVKFYTRLFPVGSSRNIDRSKYGSTRLQLPGSAKYVDIPDLVERYGVFHHYEQEAFSGIYPRRMGVISSVRWEEVKDPDGNLFTIWYFKDNGLTFDPNDYEIADLVKHVSFQSGELKGRDFEVNFNSQTREFEIITTWPYDDEMQLPDAHGGHLVPAPDNTYILWNISMPDEYYDLAEKEYQSAVEAFNREHLLDKSVYKAPTNPKWVERSGVQLYVGRRVRLESQKYFPGVGYRSSRITRLTRKVNDPCQIDLEISDAVSTGTMTKIEDSIHDVKMYVRESSSVLPDIIRSWDETKPTDNNLYSARRTHKEFLSKKNDDRVNGLITFLEGLRLGAGTYGIDGGGVGSLLSLVLKSLTGASYTGSDILGDTGFRLWEDSEGKGHLDVDYLRTRIRQYAAEVVVKRLTFSAGNVMLSAAGCEVCKVVPLDGDGAPYDMADGVWGRLTRSVLSAGGDTAIAAGEALVSFGATFTPMADGTPVSGWRCYFPAEDDGRAVSNDWVAGDMAWCQTANLTSAGDYENYSNRSYRRLVVRTGTETVDGRAMHYVDLSNVATVVVDGISCTGYYAEDGWTNDIPAVGDDIAQVGSQTRTDRQGVLQLSAVDVNPHVAIYAGVNDYDLARHRIALLSPQEVNICASYFKLSTAVGTDQPTTPLLQPVVTASGQGGVQTESIYVDGDAEGRIASLSQVFGLPVGIQVAVGGVTIPCSEWTSGTVDGVTIRESGGIGITGTGVFVRSAYKSTDHAVVEWAYRTVPQLGGDPVKPVIQPRKVVVEIAFTHAGQDYTARKELMMMVQRKGADGEAGADGTSLNVKGRVDSHINSVSDPVAQAEDDPYLIDSGSDGTAGAYIVTIDSGSGNSWQLIPEGHCYVTTDGHGYNQSQAGHLWQAQSDGWQDIGLINASDAWSVLADPSAIAMSQDPDTGLWPTRVIAVKAMLGSNARPYSILSVRSDELQATVTDGGRYVTVTGVNQHTVDGKSQYYINGTLILTVSVDGQTFEVSVSAAMQPVGTWMAEVMADTLTSVSQKYIPFTMSDGTVATGTGISVFKQSGDSFDFMVWKELEGTISTSYSGLSLYIDSNGQGHVELTGHVHSVNIGTAQQPEYAWELKEDGTGHLAGGNIRWNASGDVTFSGELSAATGTFAGTLQGVSGTFDGVLRAVNRTVYLTSSEVQESGTSYTWKGLAVENGDGGDLATVGARTAQDDSSYGRLVLVKRDAQGNAVVDDTVALDAGEGSVLAKAYKIQKYAEASPDADSTVATDVQLVICSNTSDRNLRLAFTPPVGTVIVIKKTTERGWVNVLDQDGNQIGKFDRGSIMCVYTEDGWK